MSSHFLQVGAHPGMTLDVTKTENSNKQWSSTIKSHWVRTFTSRYPSCAHSHKSVPVLISAEMLLGLKTPANKRGSHFYTLMSICKAVFLYAYLHAFAHIHTITHAYTRRDGCMARTSVSHFGRYGDSYPGRVKPMMLKFKIDTRHFLARRSAL